MGRVIGVASFVLCVALVPASAQRGGVRPSAGGRGVAVGHGGGAVHVAGPAFTGTHFGGPRSFPQGFHFSGGRGFHHRCFGCRRGFGFPWYAGYGYGGFYDPFLFGDSYSSYDYDQDQQVILANQMNALNIQEQNLREREDWLREREEQDAYERRSQVREPEPSAPSPATVLVFRDQHRQEVANYAIAGGTLWVLNDHLATRKIPLTDLDLAATTKANDERGVEFQVPK
jgi:hypothetical protein